MEKELNIAEILKNKPKGTHLYSPICGELILIEVTSNGILCNQNEYGDSRNNLVFMENGHFKNYRQWQWQDFGECLLFPSKDIRDWDKFSWKRGDVLSNCTAVCIFDKWIDDTYTKFNAKFINGKDAFNTFETRLFNKEDAERSKLFIEGLERRYGNLRRLEEQPEFKDGDILHSEDCICGYIYICKGLQREVSTAYCYKLTGGGYLHICDLDNFYDCTIPSASIISDKTRYATEEEKQQLFDALAKEGKRWNAETKQIEDLPKKQAFKPFDRVLVRMSENDVWVVDLFSHYSDERDSFKYACIGTTWRFCIPYEGNEHLLGTTNNPR